MNVRKGTKVHPASFDLVLKLKDQLGMTYEDLSDLLEVTPSRVQQIVLHQRKAGKDAYAGSGDYEESSNSSTLA